jgi:hypothetical protein
LADWETAPALTPVNFGAPGTTATDIQEGTTSEEIMSTVDRRVAKIAGSGKPKRGGTATPQKGWETAPKGWETAPSLISKQWETAKPVEDKASGLSYAAGIVPGIAESLVAGGVGMGEEAVAGIAGLGTAAVGKGFDKGYQGTKEALAPVDKLLAPQTEAGKDVSKLLGKIPEGVHALGEGTFEGTGSPTAAAGVEAAATLATFWLPTKVGPAAKALKNAVLKDAPVPKPVDPAFAKSKMRPDETISDVIARKQQTEKAATRPSLDAADASMGEAKQYHISQAALLDKTTGEIVPQGIKHDEAKKAEVVERPNIFKTTKESWEAQKDLNTHLSDVSKDKLIAKDNKPISEELDRLKDKRPRTEEENLRLASLEDQFMINHLKYNPERYLEEFRAQLKEEKDLLGEGGAYDKQRLPIVEDLLKKIDDFEAQATSKATGGHTPETESSKYKQGFLTHEGEFLNRKEALARAKDTKQIPKDHPLDFPEEGLHSGDLKRAGDPAFQPEGPLAKTDKENKITLNDSAIEQDFKKGFPYIFNPDSPTGLQKKAVFEKLGITKEQFSGMIRTPEQYKTFLKAHEQSHVDNNDRASYPKTAQGKADLMHPDAIAIEARATQEGLKVAQETHAKENMEKDIATSIDKEDTAHPSVLKSAAEVIKGSMREIRANDRKADVWGRTIEKLVPSEGLRTRITRAMEAEKETDKLPRQEKVAAAVMKQVQDRFAAIGERATKAGLMDGLRDNYVTHVLDFSKTKMSAIEQQAFLDKIFNAPKDSKLVKDFTAERKYEFLRELEKAVEGTGVVVHTDIAKIATAYEKSMLQAEVHKQMADHFSTTIAPNGKGYIVPLSQGALKEGYVPFQGKGAKPLEGMLVHPDIVAEMKFMFNQTEPPLLLRSLGAVNFLTKTLNTVGSLFHATNLEIAGATADPALAIKELFSRETGKSKALAAFRNDENNELIDGFIRDGLMVKTEDIDKTIIATTGKIADDLLSKFAPVGKEVRAVQHLTEPFDREVIQRLNHLTWDYMHAGQKLNLAMNMFTKVKAKNPGMPDTQIRQEISKFVNNTFGGLDWLEVADQVKNKYARAFAMQAAGIRGREWGQIMLFAPDWTVSTLRSFTTALPKELAKPQNWQLREGIKGMYNPKTQGDFARKYVLNTAIGYMILQNGINMALSGHPIWENKDPTKVDMGDGTTMQVAKHSMETAEWARDPMKTLSNKLGFWPKAAYVAISGKAYPSPDAPKLKDPSAFGKAKAIALTASPFQISGGMQAPEGEGLKRGVMSSLGLPIYGMSKEERIAAIRQGKIDAKEKRKQKKLEEDQ